MVALRTAETSPPSGGPECTCIADGLLASMRSFGVSATLLRSDRGIILEGIANTFYGKQMAQELARGANLVVVANRIRVERV